LALAVEVSMIRGSPPIATMIECSIHSWQYSRYVAALQLLSAVVDQKCPSASSFAPPA
jgi:hypothetical protein